MHPTLKKLIEEAIAVKSSLICNEPKKALTEIENLLATINTLGGKLCK